MRLFQGTFISLSGQAGPTLENTFYNTKILAYSNRIGLKKIHRVFLSNSGANIILLISKKKLLHIKIATKVNTYLVIES